MSTFPVVSIPVSPTMSSRLRYGLLANHSRLVRRLDLVAVMPFLVEEGLVTLDENESIMSKTTGGERSDALLTLTHRKAVSDESVYERFLAVLEDDYRSGGQQLESLVTRIRADATKEGVVARYETAPTRLDGRQKAALRSEEATLVASLNVEEIIPDLVSYGVLSLDDNEVIRDGATHNERAQRLVGLLYEKTSQQFIRFVSTLTERASYRELGKRLLVEGEAGEDVEMDGGEQDDERYVMEVLKRGHVPPRHGIYINRPQMIERVRKELRKLKDKDGWVVLHGMAGFGKTVLAAEAIRDASILREVFPDGVHWLAVGQMLTKDGEIDKPKLLTRLQNLIVRLDEKVVRPPNLESATNALQKILSKQYPRSLLILDDVWSPEVAQAFSVRCRTLVTSRNSAVASSVQAPQISSVSVSEGFSDEEGLLLLAQWLEKDPKDLPKDAEVIIDYCLGSPMVIALIGAILRKNPSKRKWKVIVDKLQKKHFHSIKLHASVNEWSYQHATLNASIELSVESLPNNLQELFDMFVVFDYNTRVSTRALEVIWQHDSIETEELLMELVGFSLVQTANLGADDSQYIVFMVHDIVLDYLRQTVPQKKQVDYHRMVVQRYSECEGALFSLPDDGYVYQKLLGHIAAAGNYELLGDLMSQLSWLISTAKSGNAISMLANYRLYKSLIPQQFSTGVQQFEFFISGHMDVLANHPTQDDIIQLALLQPNSSEVFVQASASVRGDRKKSWFKWSNKESDPEKYVLKLKLHSGGVRRCQYSRDGCKVVSCSSDCGLKLWDASNGMEVADFRGHKDMVTCCAISDSGRLVVSSSEDCTVKVWDTHRRMSLGVLDRVKKGSLVLNFRQHCYGVQCCAISPGERLVVSGDIDSCILVWELLTGTVVLRYRLSTPSPLVSPMSNNSANPPFPPVIMPLRSSSPPDGTEGVLSCAFSPDGSEAVAGTQSGTVMLWKVDGQGIRYFKGHNSQIRCIVFDQTGTLMATACLGDSSAKIWDVSSGTCSQTLSHSCPLLSCDFSPDQERLVTGDVEGVVSIWSVSLGTLLEEHLLHSDYVNCVLFSPSQPHILSAADNGIIKIQPIEDSEMPPAPSPITHYHRRFSAHFSKEGSGYVATILCYITKKKTLQLVQGSHANVVLPKLPTLDGHTPRSWNLSSDGAFVVVGFEEGALQVFTIKRSGAGEEWKGEELWHVSHAHQDCKILKSFFSPDTTRVVTCSERQHKTWCAKTGKEIATISATGIGVRPVIFFKDSVRLASAQDKGVLIWSSKTGVPILRCEGIVSSEESILCVNLSEDNKRLVASNSVGLVMVWSTDTGGVLLRSEIAPLSPCARSCALSHDGSLAAVGFDDGSLKMWRVSTVTTSQEIANCPTNSSYWMIDVSYSPDSKKVVTLCDTIDWWHNNGKHMKTICLKGSFGKYIRFSPDFKTFVTIDNAGLLYILDTLT